MSRHVPSRPGGNVPGHNVSQTPAASNGLSKARHGLTLAPSSGKKQQQQQPHHKNINNNPRQNGPASSVPQNKPKPDRTPAYLPQATVTWNIPRTTQQQAFDAITTTQSSTATSKKSASAPIARAAPITPRGMAPSVPAHSGGDINWHARIVMPDRDENIVDISTVTALQAR